MIAENNRDTTTVWTPTAEGTPTTVETQESEEKSRTAERQQQHNRIRPRGL
jgi:hypothetical protein